MTDSIHVRSVTYGVSECDPIELMNSDDGTRRLVFLPTIHSSTGKNGSVTGIFVYQRKRRTEQWEKISNNQEILSRLKAGEGFRLDLSTDSVTKLIHGLMNIDEISEHVKKGQTNTTFVPTAKNIAPIFNQLIENSTDEQILEELIGLSKENVLRFNDLVLNARIRSALKYWELNKDNDDEESWQQFFNGRPWIISLICAEPIIVLKEKMYVGGANASGKGGKHVDYGLLNKQTNNTALLEIKTPCVQLLGAEYRGLFPPSNALSGSVTQVENYKYNTLKNIRELHEDLDYFDAVNIPTYVVAGSTSQLDTNLRKRSFELYRRNCKDTTVLGFDEVFERMRLLLDRS